MSQGLFNLIFLNEEALPIASILEKKKTSGTSPLMTDIVKVLLLLVG